MERYNPSRSQEIAQTLKQPGAALAKAACQQIPTTNDRILAAGYPENAVADQLAEPFLASVPAQPVSPEPSPCATVRAAFDARIQRLECLRAALRQPAPPQEAVTRSANEQPFHPPPRKRVATQPVHLLNSTRVFLERTEHPPLLPPPRSQDFAEAFKRHEPMFHAVFFRKYAPIIRDDAKQEALLALYRRWLKNQAILEQSSSYVIQAAIYGVSNWRKKGMKVRGREARLHVDMHGKVAGEPRSHANERWTDRIDLRLDVARAIQAVRHLHRGQAEQQALVRTLGHVRLGVPFKQGQRASGLPFRVYKQQREQVKAELRAQLSEYAPPTPSPRGVT